MKQINYLLIGILTVIMACQDDDEPGPVEVDEPGIEETLDPESDTWNVYLQDQEVTSIDFENEYVWVATQKDLIRFNKQDYSTTYYPYPDNYRDTHGLLKIDKNGMKWIVRSENEDSEFNMYGFHENKEDRAVYIYGFHENKWEKVEFYRAGPVGSLAVDKNNDIWITAGPFTRNLYKLEQGVDMKCTPGNSGLVYQYVTQVASDQDGNIWLINYNSPPEFSANMAILKFDDDNWTSYSYGNDLWGYGLWRHSLTFDSQGNPWLGQRSTVKKLDTVSNSWSEEIAVDIENSLHLQTIDRENNFWFVYRYEGIMASDRDEGIVVYNGTDWEFYTTDNSNLPSNTVNQIAVDTDGTKWVATAKGLAAFNENE